MSGDVGAIYQKVSVSGTSSSRAPQAWLTDALERIASGWTKANELAQMLPRSWKAQQLADAINV
jgi:hypothetical protein